MGLSVSDAYTQIKNLENTGKITLPEPQETVVIGTIDPTLGTFTYSTPTIEQTTVLPPPPGGKKNTILNVNVGVVSTKAVDLRLQFNVVPRKLVNAPVTVVTEPVQKNGAKAAAAGTVVKGGGGILTGIGGVFGGNSGVTITGFPTLSSTATSIVVDAGVTCSAALPEAPNMTPAVSTFGVTINIPLHQSINLYLMILRPPVLGMGAFTIPALPMTIVYAPPQGKLAKNSVTYSDTVTLTRTVTSSISNSTNTKTVQAYSAADLIGKVAGAITMVVAVVGTGGAGAGAGGLAGALGGVVTALVGTGGGATEANMSTADAAKQVSSELSLMSGVLNAVDQSTNSSGGTVTVQNDNSMSLTITNMSQYGSESGLGPGVGDRVVYLKNVKVVWMAINGEVGIHVLGYDGVGANAVTDLKQEAQSIAAGNPAKLGLDAATIQQLLSYDPLTANRRVVVTALQPPLVGPPRFVPANPPGRNGSGTGSSGDQFSVSYDVAHETKQTVSNVQTTITDVKPSWVGVLFGDPNTETTTTSTFTTSQVVDDKSDDKLTSTITLFSSGVDDSYDVKVFYDCTFGTYLVLDSNSAALQGTTTGGVLTGVFTTAA